MKINIIIILIISLLLLSSCNISGANFGEGEYSITNIRIFEETPAWELAQAVRRQSTGRIKRIAEETPELLNYQDPKYGATLLIWSVGTERYRSAQALLDAGADPDVICRYTGGTALFLAADYSWVDNLAKKNPRFVNLLLKHGADPNINFIGHEVNNTPQIGTSPLMNSIACGIEKTKALVEAGANINHQAERKGTASIDALMWGGMNVSTQMREYAHYLIVEKKADITQPYYRDFVLSGDDPYEEFWPVNLLRNWVCDLDSEDYKMKMEIVEEFARQGVNYWEAPIPGRILERIKGRYPDTWEEYIKLY